MKTTLTALLIFFLASSFTQESATENIYIVDAGKSTLHWAGYPLFSFGEHNGTLAVKKGSIEILNGDVTGGGFEIDMTSMRNTDMEEDNGGSSLVNHLKSDDFFSVDKFPAAYFTITSSKKTENPGPGDPNLWLIGELTIKGVKNTLKFPALVTITDTMIKATARFKFDRTKWGVRYESGRFFDDVGDAAISDAIGIELSIVATK